MPPWARTWIHFFFGHPIRFFWTAAVVVSIMSMVWPRTMGGLLHSALVRLTLTIGPSASLLLQIGIAVGGIYILYRTLLRSFRPKAKKKGH